MATSTRSYRRSTNLTSSSRDRDGDAALKSKLEQARQERTAFYRRLADAGSRVQAGEDGTEVEVDAEMSTRRRRQRMDTSSPFCEVESFVSAAQPSLVDQMPEPRSSWRYYTSYDNGEWRRHATPMYKEDAEQDVGISSKLAERRSASMTSGLTTHDDIVDIEDSEGVSSHSRQTSALGRHQRLRGSDYLTRNLPPATSSATNTGPTTLEEVKSVMKDVFDRSRYGSGYDVSEMVQKILGERLQNRASSPPQTEDRVMYANLDRTSIQDNVTQPLHPRFTEIPEGTDEKEFVEKTLAPSGRRWTSSPPPDSQRIFIVRETLDDGYFDSGLRYEDIGAGVHENSTSMENWRNSSCRSPSNVPDTLNGDGVKSGGMEAEWTGWTRTPAAGRTVVSSETTRRHEVNTAREPASQTSTTRSSKDAFGRNIPADAVEIKVKMQRGESDKNAERVSPSQWRLDNERSSAGVEQRMDCSGDSTSYASPQRRFVGEADEKPESRSGSAVRHQNYGMSSGDGWTRVPVTKSTEKRATDNGRIWIPVIHVSGEAESKNKTMKSESSRSGQVVERDHGRDSAVSPSSGRRVQVGTESRSFVVDVADQRRQDRSGTAQFRESPRDSEVVTGRGDQSAATSSLRAGSGVGSYGYRSSIVVEPGPARDTRPAVSQSSTSRSSVVMQQSPGDGEWIIEKAL